MRNQVQPDKNVICLRFVTVDVDIYEESFGSVTAEKEMKHCRCRCRRSKHAP